LKLKYDEPLSNFAFTFDLRRYNLICTLEDNQMYVLGLSNSDILKSEVGRCRLTLSNPR
jgi:hypothetical protein